MCEKNVLLFFGENDVLQNHVHDQIQDDAADEKGCIGWKFLWIELGSQGNGTCEDANTHLQIAQAHILNITAAKYDLGGGVIQDTLDAVGVL
jgi:hypothetical protein